MVLRLVRDFVWPILVWGLITRVAELQYLEWSDFCRYVQALHASREHILNDPAYLRILHQQHLAAVAFEPKKDSV